MNVLFSLFFFFFFFNDTATTEIYTLSLHDALPIYGAGLLRTGKGDSDGLRRGGRRRSRGPRDSRDRKSTRLNSSHVRISYAVFCLKKKKKKIPTLLGSDYRQEKAKRARTG